MEVDSFSGEIQFEIDANDLDRKGTLTTRDPNIEARHAVNVN